jgi:hypothetical protein
MADMQIPKVPHPKGNLLFPGASPAEEAGSGGEDGRDHARAARRAVPAVLFVNRRLDPTQIGSYENTCNHA